jgi:ABC-type multidrug transport system fused ATPase/permease subunit
MNARSPGDPALAASTPPPIAPTGAVHDLGYRRYLGTRRPRATRWRVIARQQVAYAWKTWWRFKLGMVSAIIATLVTGAVMYLASDTLMQILGRGGAPGGGAGLGIRFVDGILPLSVLWYCKIGFITSMTVAASVIAGDARSGAFSFYFARPVRTVDYVLGKVVGLMMLASALVMVGPVLLALFRIGLGHSTEEMAAQVPGVFYALVVGGLGTLLYAVVPLGFSALIADRRWAVGFWALYYIAFGSIMSALGKLAWAPLAALDLSAALSQVSFSLFDVTIGRGDAPQFALPWGVGSILGHVALALGVVSWRVAKAARDGVGGLS